MSSVFLKGLYIGTVVGAATTEIVRKFADNIDDNDATIKNSKNRESLQLILFYDNLCSTYENPSHFLGDIQKWTMYSKNWTKYHGYIQWIFPIPFILKGDKKYNDNFYPQLTKSTALHLRNDYAFNEKFKINMNQFLLHLGIKRNGSQSTIDSYFVFDESRLKHWNSNSQIRHTYFIYLTRLILSIRCLMIDYDADMADVLAYTLFKLNEMDIIDTKDDASSNFSISNLWKAALLEPNLYGDDISDYDLIYKSMQYSKISSSNFLKICRRRFYEYTGDSTAHKVDLTSKQNIDDLVGPDTTHGGSVSPPKSEGSSTSKAKKVDDLEEAISPTEDNPSFWRNLFGY